MSPTDLSRAGARPISRWLECESCAQHFGIEECIWACTSCGGVLVISPSPGIRRDEICSKDRSLWRYRSAIAVPPGPVISLGEGGTPMVSASWAGGDVQFKLEYVSPSGSFKDRGMSALVTNLCRRGIDRVTEDSSGNAGASLALYTARAGIACRVFVPASTPAAKVAPIRAAGAELEFVPGSREATAQAARKIRPDELYVGHNWQPFYLEGVTTIGYEIWEDLGFSVPNCIVMPLGGGSNLIGCFRAFDALLRSGAGTSMPRLYGVQSTSCAPFLEAYRRGWTHTSSDYRGGYSVAEGIALARPVRSREVLHAVRVSSGAVVPVDDHDIVQAMRDLARKGFFVEPTAAAAAAGHSALVAGGLIDPGERCVIVLTGSGYKNIDVHQRTSEA